MTQLELVASPPIAPRAGTQCARLLERLRAGDSFTVQKALDELGIYALSQRCGELIVMGWPISSEWFDTTGGARVKRYYYAGAKNV